MKSVQLKPLLAMLIAGSLACAIAGAAYGAALWYSAWIVLTLLFVVALTCSIGALMAKLAIRTAMPHRWLLDGLTVWGVLVALYMAWATHAAIRIPGLGVHAWNPRALMAFLEWLYANDKVILLDERQDTVIRGAGLVVLWVVELLVTSVGAVLLARKMFDDLAPPFCFDCRRWMTVEYGLLRLQLPDDPDECLEAIGAGNLSVVGDLPAGDVDDDPHLRIDLVRCPACARGGSMSVAFLSYTATPSEVYLCKHRPLTEEQVSTLLQCSTRSDPHDHG